MNGIPEFFGSGPGSVPIPPDQVQLVSLIGFILVSMVYVCGSLKKKPEEILDVMLASESGHPQLQKAVAFVRDALKKHPSSAYYDWFLERSDFDDFMKRWKASNP